MVHLVYRVLQLAALLRVVRRRLATLAVDSAKRHMSRTVGLQEVCQRDPPGSLQGLGAWRLMRGPILLAGQGQVSVLPLHAVSVCWSDYRG